ncbi:hypothetical protein PVAND_000446 [Polypedilum vanderplanki]|uniref:U6 snRNA-associated Sm-like protein LSm8 n=1 Tax=Polypedilum vanderplanki TaxID=319348 RepID=A0A9J6BK47_POLVA|nr:hypothetical protein PVAND_000446 [Polypedilum vanderplanki]
MSGSLESFVGQSVMIISCDGRCFSGTLKGFDQLINLILVDTHERIYSTTAGMEQINLGLKIIRGDNVAVIGLIDEAVEQEIDYQKIRGEQLNPVVH